MKRHWVVTVLVIVESLFAFAALGLGAYLFRLSFIGGVTHVNVVSVREAAAIFCTSGLIWVALATLLVFFPRWGWWLGASLNLAAAMVLCLDTGRNWRQSGWDDIALATVVAVMAMLYLFPPVRRYRRLKAGEIPHNEISSAVGA